MGDRSEWRCCKATSSSGSCSGCRKAVSTSSCRTMHSIASRRLHRQLWGQPAVFDKPDLSMLLRHRGRGTAACWRAAQRLTCKTGCLQTQAAAGTLGDRVRAAACICSSISVHSHCYQSKLGAHVSGMVSFSSISPMLCVAASHRPLGRQAGIMPSTPPCRDCCSRLCRSSLCGQQRQVLHMPDASQP